MADDFRVKVGFLNHPKTLKLKRRLGGDGVLAFLQLWEFCTTARTDGALVGLDDEDIELAARWGGKPGAFVEALVAVRYLDGEEGTRQVHEWSEHQAYVVRQCDRNATASANAYARWHRAGRHAVVPRAGCPLCEQAESRSVNEKPEQTSPSNANHAPAYAAHCDRTCGALLQPTNLPTNQPTNLPTNTALPVAERVRRVSVPAAAPYRVRSDQVVEPESLQQVVASWGGWTTKAWASRWSGRAEEAARRVPITLGELACVRDALEAEVAKPNVGLLVTRLERSRNGRAMMPRQLSFPIRRPEARSAERAGWDDCSGHVAAILAALK